MFLTKKNKQKKFALPHDLTALGYQIDEGQRLRTLSGDLYVFAVKDRPYNEALYDRLVGWFLCLDLPDEQCNTRLFFVQLIY